MANLTLNQSESQRNLEEKENILSLMIYAMRYNQSLDQEEVTHLKGNVTSLDNKQRTLQSTVNANVNTQISLQSQITSKNVYICLKTHFIIIIALNIEKENVVENIFNRFCVPMFIKSLTLCSTIQIKTSEIF